MRRNKKFLLIALPVAVVLPLLILTWLMGPVSLWLWAGIGVGMAYVSWSYRKRQRQNQAGQ